MTTRSAALFFAIIILSFLGKAAGIHHGVRSPAGTEGMIIDDARNNNSNNNDNDVATAAALAARQVGDNVIIRTSFSTTKTTQQLTFPFTIKIAYHHCHAAS
jgi:hypothetical protein